MKEIIKVDNISYTYPDGFKALKKISFSINKGEKVGIIGANGAGKSTILKILTGLIEAERGTITIDGLKLEKKNLKAIRKKLGLVFQDSDNQLFMNRVYDDIAFGLRSSKVEKDIVKEEVSKILKSFNIEHLKDKQIYKLSGGEKKNVALAGIFIMKSEIILMDEPTVSLDPKSRREMINLIKEIPNTSIITSHDLDMILDVCDRVIVFFDGVISEQGEAFKILSNKKLMEENGLELPLSLQ
ncbi:cobalt/nickel transport system ATP-binding protein [Clostridium sp. DSM 8431]|uniref:energy-coupling factor ABC transporter ATP-binding protein n=1 Tax=Clostridium sp. DSM 8431 TaxID=1761781 RepID=UPI0008F27BED|nr:ABC transporter ATP-binding protein [Clostridium sp. DSM 8431]SFU81771.1 cobalt/nickel transport system ATP-binding protein [Clostridium sp. DSM 8431]